MISFWEVVVILFVALLVFNPSKLPMLAHHLAGLLRQVQQAKQKLTQLWQSQLNQYQLEENIKKAKQADEGE